MTFSMSADGLVDAAGFGEADRFAQRGGEPLVLGVGAFVGNCQAPRRIAVIASACLFWACSDRPTATAARIL